MLPAQFKELVLENNIWVWRDLPDGDYNLDDMYIAVHDLNGENGIMRANLSISSKNTYYLNKIDLII